MAHGMLSVGFGILLSASAGLAQVATQPAPAKSAPAQPAAPAQAQPTSPAQAPTTFDPPKPEALRLPDGVRRLADLEYGAHPLQKLDLYLPDNAANAIAANIPPMPLIVYIHSGEWKEGDKLNCPATPWVPGGCAVASINYRLTPEVTIKDMLADCANAIIYLRAHSAKYNIDPNRVGVWGASAGGYLAAMLGAQATSPACSATVGPRDPLKNAQVQAVCAWFAPMDLAALDPKGKGFENVLALVGLAAGSADTQPLKCASPISRIEATTPPFILFHGDSADQPVPLAQSQSMAAALKKAGVPVELVVVPGQGRGFRPKNEFDKHVEATRIWFIQQFKNQ